MHLCFAIGAELLQIQIGDINPLRAARLQNTGIPGALQLGKVGYPIKNTGAAIAVRNRLGIISGGNRQHVFKGPGTQLGQAVDFHRAGVWHKDQLCALQH